MYRGVAEEGLFMVIATISCELLLSVPCFLSRVDVVLLEIGVGSPLVVDLRGISSMGQGIYQGIIMFTT